VAQQFVPNGSGFSVHPETRRNAHLIDDAEERRIKRVVRTDIIPGLEEGRTLSGRHSDR